MGFATVINCMDGRVQLPVIEYLQKRFSAAHIDSITEPGPNLVLSDQSHDPLIESIKQRLEISVNVHKSKGIAIVGHHDCAGNPSHKDLQWEHIRKSIDFVRSLFPNLEVIGLWVDDNFEVEELTGL